MPPSPLLPPATALRPRTGHPPVRLTAALPPPVTPCHPLCCRSLGAACSTTGLFTTTCLWGAAASPPSTGPSLRLRSTPSRERWAGQDGRTEGGEMAGAGGAAGGGPAAAPPPPRARGGAREHRPSAAGSSAVAAAWASGTCCDPLWTEPRRRPPSVHARPLSTHHSRRAFPSAHAAACMPLHPASLQSGKSPGRTPSCANPWCGRFSSRHVSGGRPGQGRWWRRWWRQRWRRRSARPRPQSSLAPAVPAHPPAVPWPLACLLAHPQRPPAPLSRLAQLHAVQSVSCVQRSQFRDPPTARLAGALPLPNPPGPC